MIPATSAAPASGGGLGYQWIIVGASGALYTSTSTLADTWTSRTSSFGTTGINCVASNGTNLYIAGGDTGKVATSPDGITWTQRTSGTTNNIKWIAYGNDGYWVMATGESNTVRTSTDGITWTARTTAGLTGSVNSCAWGNSLWVAADNNGNLCTATDPTGTWTSRTSTLTGINAGEIAYFKNSSIWVAGNDTGTTGALASSTDGATWTARDSTINIPALFQGTGLMCASTTVAVSCQVITGPSGDIETSTNGTTWTNRTPAVSASFICIASDNNQLFAIGSTTNIQTSPDGTTWTTRGNPGITPRGICHSSGTAANR